jgi:hypothetical protein
LHLPSGRYFSITGSGILIWETLREGATLDEIAAVVIAAFDVPSERAKEDIRSLMHKLVDAGLVECTGSAE